MLGRNYTSLTKHFCIKVKLFLEIHRKPLFPFLLAHLYNILLISAELSVSPLRCEFSELKLIVVRLNSNRIIQMLH